MGFTASAIFEQAMLSIIGGLVASTTAPASMTSTGLIGDTVNVALFGNTGTPDRTVTAANSAYGVSQWVTGNETNGGANWPAGGLVLGTRTWALDTGSTSICFHAPSLAGTGNVTVAAAFGCEVYDNTLTTAGATVAKQGICYNYFGGSQSVTSGTFTIIWATVGATTAIFNITV